MTAWNILYRDCEEALGAARDVVARLEHVLASFEFKPVRGLRFPQEVQAPERKSQ